MAGEPGASAAARGVADAAPKAVARAWATSFTALVSSVVVGAMSWTATWTRAVSATGWTGGCRAQRTALAPATPEAATTPTATRARDFQRAPPSCRAGLR